MDATPVYKNQWVVKNQALEKKRAPSHIDLAEEEIQHLTIKCADYVELKPCLELSLRKGCALVFLKPLDSVYA